MDRTITLTTQNGKTLEIINNIDIPQIISTRRKSLQTLKNNFLFFECIIGGCAISCGIILFLEIDKIARVFALLMFLFIAAFFAVYAEFGDDIKDAKIFNIKYPKDDADYDIEEIICMIPADASFRSNMIRFLKELPASSLMDYKVIMKSEGCELQFIEELPLSGDISTKSVFVREPQFNTKIRNIQIVVHDRGIEIKLPMEYMYENPKQ